MSDRETSVWFCVRCGRGQRFDHDRLDSDDVLAALASGQHAERLRSRWVRVDCETDRRLISIARNSTDMSALVAASRPSERSEKR